MAVISIRDIDVAVQEVRDAKAAGLWGGVLLPGTIGDRVGPTLEDKAFGTTTSTKEPIIQGRPLFCYVVSPRGGTATEISLQGQPNGSSGRS